MNKISKIKEKIRQGWNWIKAKTKQVLITLGIIGVALATGTQTTILDTSPINYPLTANTNFEKLEYLYEGQEALRLQHNKMGRQYREGIITEEQWQIYLKNVFNPKNQIIAEWTAKIGELLEDVAVQTATGTTMYKARGYYKEAMKQSTTWLVDLDTIIK